MHLVISVQSAMQVARYAEHDVILQLDVPNRLIQLCRWMDGGPSMEMHYDYYDNGFVHAVAQGDRAQTNYYYDAADQVAGIDHSTISGDPPRLFYTYNAHGLPVTLTEKDGLDNDVAVVTFTYDDRGRLIHEVRTGYGAYGLAYEYDQGGNGTRRVEAVNEVEVQYRYDLEDPEAYGSANNRLMYYKTYDTGGADDILVSTTYYFYNVMGNVTRVVTELEEPGDNPRYSATRFGYASNGQAVTFVVGETWDWERCMCGEPCCEDTCEDAPCPQQPCPINYAITYAREFRYDGGRARYLNRELDPVALRTTGALVPLRSTWSDYDGDWIYGDFTIDDEWNVTYEYSYEPGVARITDPFGMYRNTEYYHGDLIGTTRDLSDGGHSTAPSVYTAFGELIVGTNHRYGYAGAWGYQAHEEFPFVHVGYRYYDPATGRFLQRDPIGIAGGVNVYLYASNGPTIRVDANGLQSADDVLSCQDQCHRWVRTGGAATCTLHAGLQDCYNSCFKGHWPPGSVRPMPPNFTPWPGVCPPVGTGVPTPGTGKPGTPVAPPTNLPVNPPSSGCGGGGGSGGGGAAAMGFLLPLAFLVSLRFARSRSRWRRVDFTKRMDAR